MRLLGFWSLVSCTDWNVIELLNLLLHLSQNFLELKGGFFEYIRLYLLSFIPQVALN